jgi:hypothetical protein
MGPQLPLPYTEQGYRLDCDQVVLGSTIVLNNETWAKRDSVEYQCRPRAEAGDSTLVARDTVESEIGSLRVAGDTLHFDYYISRNDTYSEIEIGQIVSDTLETGLGLSGSTPRKYIRRPTS